MTDQTDNSSVTDVHTLLAQLSDNDISAVSHIADWHSRRRKEQTEPVGDWWTIWFFKAGRGSGKTRTAVEWVFENAWMTPNSRWLAIAPTYGDLAGVCFEGESGFLAVIPRDLIVPNKNGGLYDSTSMEIRLKNGSLIKGISADNPERLRGHQWHGAWSDEHASNSPKDAEDILSNIMFALRLGERPKMIITSTPKPTPFIKNLVKRSDVVITTGSSYDNLENLAPTFRKQLEVYQGTRLGRQEIYAEILSDDQEAIIKRSFIKMWPSELPLPHFRYILGSYDTAFSERTRDKKRNVRDPTACNVWGVFQHKDPVTGKLKDAVMLLDAYTDYLGFPELMSRIKKDRDLRYGDQIVAEIKPNGSSGRPTQERAQGRRMDNIVIEDKGSGKSIIQQLAFEGIFAKSYNPGQADKVTRLHRVSHIFAQGMIWIPESKKSPGEFVGWAVPYLEELTSYSGEGSTAHDDQVDATSQAIAILMDMRVFEQPRHKLQPEEKFAEDEERNERRSKGNPYS